MNLQFAVTLKSPAGDAWDVTRRLVDDQLGTLTETPEEDLTELVHNDLQLELDDRDGFLSGLLADVQPGASWEIVIERETGRRRPKWRRVFAGVLDPLTIERDDQDLVLVLDLYSYGKRLENVSAEGYKRTVTGKTCSGTLGTKTLTVSPDTTSLSALDVVTISGGGKTESRRIDRVDSSSQVTLTENLTNTYAAGSDLVLETPYYRGLTIAQVATDLLALAGVNNPVVLTDVTAGSAGPPFPSAMNSQGLPTGTPSAMLEKAGKVAVYSNANRYEATDATSGFGAGAADTAKQDWAPYLLTDPGTYYAGSRTKVYDYTDAAHPYFDLTLASGVLRLRKNGVNLVTVETNTLATSWAYSVEVASSWGQVWVTYTWHYRIREGEFPDWTWTEERRAYTKVYDTAGALLFTLNDAGALRFSRQDDRMFRTRAWTNFSLDVGGPQSYDPPFLERLTSTASTDASLERVTGPDLWTFRRFGNWWACVAGLYVHVWDVATKQLVASFKVATSTAGNPEATAFDKGNTITPEFLCWVGGNWVSVSLRATAVLPYADTTGLSVAGALKELAIMSAAYLTVDEFGVVYLVSRGVLGQVFTSPALDVGRPLNRKRRNVWEAYRTGVVFKGKDPLDQDIEIRVGNTGDSANALEIQPKMPIDGYLGGVLTQAYLSVLHPEPAVPQWEITVPEPEDGLVRSFQKVTLDDGLTYRVFRSEADLDAQQQALVVVPVTED